MWLAVSPLFGFIGALVVKSQQIFDRFTGEWVCKGKLTKEEQSKSGFQLQLLLQYDEETNAMNVRWRAGDMTPDKFGNRPPGTGRQEMVGRV